MAFYRKETTILVKIVNRKPKKNYNCQNKSNLDEKSALFMHIVMFLPFLQELVKDNLHRKPKKVEHWFK